MVNKLKSVSSLTFLLTFFTVAGAQHFVPAYLEYSDNPFLAMNITAISAVSDGVALETGDEIGIFDGDVCVGSGLVNGTIEAPSNMLAMVVSAQDGNTPGYTAGNSIIYRFWDASAQVEVTSVEATYQPGETLSDVFTNQGSAYVTLTGEGGDADPLGPINKGGGGN